MLYCKGMYCCAADFSLLNLPKGKSLGRSKPTTSSYAQAPQHVSELGYLFHDKSSLHIIAWDLDVERSQLYSLWR